MPGPAVVALLAALALAAEEPGPVRPEPVLEHLGATLDNGLRVSIVADPSLPLVATQVWYHVGSAHEAAGQKGLAHLLEHLMFGRTRTRAEDAYERYHYRHGGRENAYTNPDETVYHSLITPPAHREVLAFEADRMRNLVLDQDVLDDEKRIVTEELRLTTENDPFSRLLVTAQKDLLGAHPYSYSPTGTKADIAAATLEACRGFYDAYYRPQNAHVIVSGPVDPRATLAEVRRLFEPIPPGGETPPEVPSLVDWSFPGEIVLTEDIPPVEIALAGFALPPRGSPDHWALVVLRELLAGGEVTPFRELVVARGKKAVEAGTEILSARRGGVVLLYSVNLPYRRRETAFRHIEQAREEMARFGWLSAESLASAKRALTLREHRQRYFADLRAGLLGQALWHLGDVRLAFDAPGRIRSVTLEEVKSAYRRYLGGEPRFRIYIKPRHVPLYVRLFGWLYPLVSR